MKEIIIEDNGNGTALASTFINNEWKETKTITHDECVGNINALKRDMESALANSPHPLNCVVATHYGATRCSIQAIIQRTALNAFLRNCMPVNCSCIVLFNNEFTEG